MDLVSLDTINKQFLLYKDLRSVERFLYRAGLNILKLGRGKWIERDEFEKYLEMKVDICKRNQRLGQKRTKYKTQGESEKLFLSTLAKKFSEL